MKSSTIKPFMGFIETFSSFLAEELKTFPWETQEINEIMERTRNHFESIRPLIPDISPSSPWLKNLIGISYETGLWKELEKRGISLTDISIMTQKALGNLFCKIFPIPQKAQAIGQAMCSMQYVAQIAKESKLNDDGKGWLIECVSPDSQSDFDIGMNIHRCPVADLCKRCGTERYFPYFCINDYVTHSVMGIRLKRTQTLAHGAPLCDFRLKAGILTKPQIICTPEDLAEFHSTSAPHTPE